MDLIKVAEQAFAQEEKNFPAFKAGDTITVTYRIKEENKERLQKFRGVVIQRKGSGVSQTFTVRKISNG
ncbi:MAG: 50S ribosomal protein L19, partial [Bacteroidales bacterium]|nr:50S ribosomal protein L19 [Bacteroidales bacterium]